MVIVSLQRLTESQKSAFDPTCRRLNTWGCNHLRLQLHCLQRPIKRRGVEWTHSAASSTCDESSHICHITLLSPALHPAEILETMRLLILRSNGKLAWEEFNQDKIPPYAILSHTWGSEEVSFLDLVHSSGTSKAGYRKIVFCGEQAARDGLRYFWVDTCCIDKRDNTELTKAINSMFRWYRNAKKCYVYISDISTLTSDPRVEMRQSEWEADFRRSRWFTRSWTLQELLAPESVIFYSSQYQRLGDKQTLAGLIHEITGIPLPALHGNSLNTFSVAERLSWAAKRQTTEPEDSAYSLLGIFNVFMPLIYGEGKDMALKRLQREIDGLPVTCMRSVTDRVLFWTTLTLLV
jgi:hypothetical protein